MNRPNFLLSFLALAILVLFLPSCSDTPTNTGTGSPDNVGTVDPNGDANFLLGAVNGGPGYSGRLEVWASNLTVEPTTVSFDAVIRNASRTDITTPLYFIITQIQPGDVEASNPDDAGPDGPIYDFSDDVGDDGILSAGESSEPVTMAFTWPEPMSFSIGFRIEAGRDTIDTGYISGIVFNDLNDDGEYQPNIEAGIPGIAVEMQASASEVLYHAITNQHGAYIFQHLQPDIYKVSALGGPHMRPTTPNPVLVTLVRQSDGTVSNLEGVNFGFFVSEVPPPEPFPIFGPVDVGPPTSNGTVLDTTFLVPDFFAAVNLYLRVDVPDILGPFPIDIDEVVVDINDQRVYEFVCPPDSICTPMARVLLDQEALHLGWQNKLHIRVEADEHSFLLFSIEAQNVYIRKD